MVANPGLIRTLYHPKRARFPRIPPPCTRGRWFCFASCHPVKWTTNWWRYTPLSALTGTRILHTKKERERESERRKGKVIGTVREVRATEDQNNAMRQGKGKRSGKVDSPVEPSQEWCGFSHYALRSSLCDVCAFHCAHRLEWEDMYFDVDLFAYLTLLPPSLPPADFPPRVKQWGDNVGKHYSMPPPPPVDNQMRRTS